ncbi:hypothetical protein ACFVFI_09170 [Streptomyces sp. NPDC057705]|uniref:hypothetical protein n=1 Tax=Streptomyces sp. NPDC057705 TaxID=3346222 RepID=UPI0036A9AA13
MTFTVPALSNPVRAAEEGKASFAVMLPSVPPCSDMVFTTDNMKYKTDVTTAAWSTPWYDLPNSKGWWGFKKRHPQIRVFVADFNDRDGVRWRRTQGLLSRNPKEPDPKPGMWGVVSAVSPQPLKSCGDQGKPAD